MPLQVTFYYILSSPLQQWLQHYLNSMITASVSNTKTAEEEMSHSNPTPPALSLHARFTVYALSFLKSKPAKVRLIFGSAAPWKLAFLFPFPWHMFGIPLAQKKSVPSQDPNLRVSCSPSSVFPPAAYLGPSEAVGSSDDIQKSPVLPCGHAHGYFSCILMSGSL